jgi:multiple sugar transport system substrate-binding protein
VFNLLKEFYAIPGYIQNGKHTHSTDVFFKEQRMAMYPNWVAAISSFFTNAGTKDAFKWDLTAHPGFSDRKGLGKEVDYHMIVVNKSSKNLEAAHYVVKEMVTKEVQTILSRAGRISVLKDESIRSQYGADSDVYKGKDLQSIFKVTPSPLPPASKFDAKINSILINEAAKAVAIDGVDVNTALRNAEEKANKEVIIPELGK